MFIWSTNTIVSEFAGYPGGFIVDDALIARSNNTIRESIMIQN